MRLLDHPGSVIRSGGRLRALVLCAALVGPAGAVGSAHAATPGLGRTKPVDTETERVQAVVTGGLLVISVEVRPEPKDDGRVHEPGPLVVTVRDTRAGSLGWTLGGIAGGFTAQGGRPIRSDVIRWNPKVLDSSPSVRVTPNASGTGTPIDQDRRAASRQLASAAVGSSIGTAVIGTDLGVPLTSQEEEFRGDITFTVI